MVAGITPFNFPAIVPWMLRRLRSHAGTASSSSPPRRIPRPRCGPPSSSRRQACRTGSSTASTATRWPSTGCSSIPGSPRCRSSARRRSRVHLRDRDQARQARAGAGRGEEPHDRAPGRRHRDGRRRRGLGGLRLRGRALHGGLRAGGRRRRRRAARGGDQGATAEGQGRQRHEPDSEMGPLVTREHRDKVAAYIASGPSRERRSSPTGGRRRPRATGSSSACLCSTT